MIPQPTPNLEAIPPSAAAHGSALPEWMDTPEKRRHIFVWMALAAAFVGHEESAKEFEQYALREDAQCAVPIAPN